LYKKHIVSAKIFYLHFALIIRNNILEYKNI